MKYFAHLLVILATVLVSQTEAKPLDSLHNLDNTVTATVDFLEAFKIAFGVDADKKFASYEENKNSEVASTVDDVLREVQEKGEESGKDVGHCNEKVTSKLEKAQQKALVKLDKCFQKKAPDWTVHNDDFDKLIIRGKELHDKNEQIEKNCKSKWSWIIQLCTFTKLPKVGVTVGLYKRDVAEFKELLSSSFYAAMDIIDKCIEEPLANFVNKVEDVRTNALKCIETA